MDSELVLNGFKSIEFLRLKYHDIISQLEKDDKILIRIYKVFKR